jgi:hypothetical protein
MTTATNWTKSTVEVTPAIICIIPIVFYNGELAENIWKWYVGVKPEGLFFQQGYREDILLQFLKGTFTVSFNSYHAAREYADNLANNTGRVVEVMPSEVI